MFHDNIKIIELDKFKKKKYHNKIIKFENELSNWYPLGNDFFKINHGRNYYAFFDRLGKSIYMTCVNDDNIVGIGCSVLRNIPLNYNSRKLTNVFYLCDLKIHPKFRGLHLPFKMLLKGIKYYNITDKAYGITMDNKKKINKVVKLAKNIPIKFKIAGKLMIYSLNFDDICKALPIIIRNRGQVYFKSLVGIKNLILKSTNNPMNLLHIQYNKIYPYNLNENVTTNPIKNFTHMFCCPKNDIMYSELLNIGIITDITATIIHYNMDNSDWRFIMTSDI